MDQIDEPLGAEDLDFRHDDTQIIAGFDGLLTNIEATALAKAISDITTLQQADDLGQCDHIFGTCSKLCLVPCIDQSLASRAASFRARQLIPAVLVLQQQRGVPFHKGTLFHPESHLVIQSPALNWLAVAETHIG